MDLLICLTGSKIDLLICLTGSVRGAGREATPLRVERGRGGRHGKGETWRPDRPPVRRAVERADQARLRRRSGPAIMIPVSTTIVPSAASAQMPAVSPQLPMSSIAPGRPTVRVRT